MKYYIISPKAKENIVEVENKQIKNKKVNNTAIEIAELYLKIRYPISYTLIGGIFKLPNFNVSKIYNHFALKDKIVIKDARRSIVRS